MPQSNKGAVEGGEQASPHRKAASYPWCLSPDCLQEFPHYLSSAAKTSQSHTWLPSELRLDTELSSILRPETVILDCQSRAHISGGARLLRTGDKAKDGRERPWCSMLLSLLFTHRESSPPSHPASWPRWESSWFPLPGARCHLQQHPCQMLHQCLQGSYKGMAPCHDQHLHKHTAGLRHARDDALCTYMVSD